MSKNIRQVVLPILAAAIWGSAFVFQNLVSDTIGAFTFNACRAIIATIFLFLLYQGICRQRKVQGTFVPQPRKQLLLGGLACGLCLSVATNLQQIGIADTSAGKAGFITAMYMVLVPIFGLFLKKRVSPIVWFSVVLASVGLYFLSIQGGFTLTSGDFYIMLCAIVFALHILFIDHYTQYVDGIALSCAQFAVTSVVSLLVAAFTEVGCWGNIMDSIWPILYVGIFSSGVAYTLQIVAQKGSNPTVVSLLLSLESVFAVISGALILHERLSARELLGCGLIMIAVVLTQLPQKNPKQA